MLIEPPNGEVRFLYCTLNSKMTHPPIDDL